MDVDIVKTSASDDMMAMMMQMEKFPEFCDPFYNNTLTNELQGSSSSNTTTTTSSISTIFNINPNVTVTPPSLIDSPPLSSNVNFITNPIQQQNHMTLPFQQEANPTGRFRGNSISSNLNNNTSFPYPSSEKRNSMAAMREMIFRIAVMQPIHIDPEAIKPPKRRNVKISKDPQSVAARHRRERISERIRILQRLVPGGTKMDTASMLDEAIHYVKFLKKQVQTLEQAGANRPIGGFSSASGMLNSNNNVNYSALLMKGCQPYQMLGSSSKQLLS